MFKKSRYLYPIAVILLIQWLSATALAAERPTDVWTVSGELDEIHVRHYTGSTEQKWDKNSEVIDLQNEALKIDKSVPADRKPSLRYGVVSPSGRYLLCSWFGLWLDTRVHGFLCVYDLRERQPILNLGTSGGFTYPVCGWLNDTDIRYRTESIDNHGKRQDLGLFATSVTTGQSRPLIADELRETLSVLGTDYKRIHDTAKLYKSLGFKSPPAAEFGSGLPIDRFFGYRSSTAAVSADGKVAALLQSQFRKNEYSQFYQLLKDGKPLARINTVDFRCDSIEQIRFAGQFLCVSVRHGDRHNIQIWTPERKPEMVAELAGKLVLDQAHDVRQNY